MTSSSSSCCLEGHDPKGHKVTLLFPDGLGVGSKGRSREHDDDGQPHEGTLTVLRPAEDGNGWQVEVANDKPEHMDIDAYGNPKPWQTILQFIDAEHAEWYVDDDEGKDGLFGCTQLRLSKSVNKCPKSPKSPKSLAKSPTRSPAAKSPAIKSPTGDVVLFTQLPDEQRKHYRDRAKDDGVSAAEMYYMETYGDKKPPAAASSQKPKKEKKPAVTKAKAGKKAGKVKSAAGVVRKVLDPKTNNFYYHNTDTDQVGWNPEDVMSPLVLTPPPPSSPSSPQRSRDFSAIVSKFNAIGGGEAAAETGEGGVDVIWPV